LLVNVHLAGRCRRLAPIPIAALPRASVNPPQSRQSPECCPRKSRRAPAGALGAGTDRAWQPRCGGPSACGPL